MTPHLLMMKVTSRVTTKSTKGLSQQSVGMKYGFRSGLEVDTAADLEDRGVPFTYEEDKIEFIRPLRSSKYTPDFIIRTRPDGTPRTTPLIIETKGRFLTDDRQKHLLIKRQHPDLDIRFVFNNPNAKISKGSSSTYGSWCTKYGFLFAKGRIPQEWILET